MADKFSTSNFEKEVLQSKEPILIDFYADWCGPCKALAPVLDELDTQTSIRIGKVNVDENPELAREYRVMNIPCMVIFKDGKPADRKVGLLSYEELEEWVGEFES